MWALCRKKVRFFDNIKQRNLVWTKDLGRLHWRNDNLVAVWVCISLNLTRKEPEEWEQDWVGGVSSTVVGLSKGGMPPNWRIKRPEWLKYGKGGPHQRAMWALCWILVYIYHEWEASKKFLSRLWFDQICISKRQWPKRLEKRDDVNLRFSRGDET